MLTDLFKTAVMTPLAQQVVALGICSHCHKKALRFIYACEFFTSHQCTKCLHVFMSESTPAARRGEG